MRDLLLLIAIALAAYLAYDDYSKRGALKAAQAEIQRLGANQAQTGASQAPDYRPVARSFAPVTPAPPPAWFQERLNQRTSLDEPVRHKQTQEDDQRKDSRYGSPTRP